MKKKQTPNSEPEWFAEWSGKTLTIDRKSETEYRLLQLTFEKGRLIEVAELARPNDQNVILSHMYVESRRLWTPQGCSLPYRGKVLWKQ